MSLAEKRKEELKRRSDNAVKTAVAQGKQENKMGDLGSFHLETIEKVAEGFGSDIKKGLTSQKIQEIMADPNFKPNELTPPPKVAWYWKFFEHLTGLFSLLLWTAGGLCFLAVLIDSRQVEYLYLGIVLSAVVFMTGCFSYYQDAAADAVMEGFKNMMPPEVLVIRDGASVPVLIPAKDLVCGDLIQLKAGDKIPADCRVVSGFQIEVDNSSLTGENLAQKRNADVSSFKRALEATNILYYGTSQTNGNGTAFVVRTGDQTAMGRIASLVRDTEQVETPIAIEIHHFIKIVTYVAVFLGVTFVIIGFVKGIPPVDNLVFGIGIIVANVPEGLLATVTVSLTLTSKRMHQKQVLVKNLEAVETLGSTTVIASDKTGTLTCNRMTVVNVFYDQNLHICNAGSLSAADETFQLLKNTMTLCNTATFVESDMAKHPKKRATNGDATESAMIKFVEELWMADDTGIMEQRKKYKELCVVPFSSKNKFAASVRDMGSSHVVYLKGAPERVIDRCENILIKGQVTPITPAHREVIDEALRGLMLQGQRVLGCAYSECKLPDGETEYKYDGGIVPTTEEEEMEGKERVTQANFPLDPRTGLVFCGLAALMDPPRPAVPLAVLCCKNASIQVIMVTGDHPDTAEAIAREVHIINGETARSLCFKAGKGADSLHEFKKDPKITAAVCTGSDLLTLTDEDLDELLDHREIVFARTSPAQKLRIVQGLQKKKLRKIKDETGKVVATEKVRNVVAVTGDGVNDSPALKAADIGIAMGIVGSAVAKDSADMILIDDNFASLVQGVEEGRLIFDNLKKSIAYTLSSNIPEISPFLLFILVQIPLPLPTVLILCIDLGTDMVPAISLAYENKEANIMQKPPRDMNTDRLVTTKLVVFSYLQIGIIQAVAGFYCYFVVLNDYGFDPSMLPWLANGFSFEYLQPSPFSAATLESMRPQDWEELRYTIEQPTSLDFDGISYPLKPCNFDMPSLGNKNPCHYPEEALAHAQCAFFISIIVVQWADLICCKTRELSLMTQGMRNGWLNFGLLWETVLGALLCYITPLNVPFGTRPMHALHWVPAMPFCMIIFTYDETRKYLMRSLGKDNWLWKNTYY